MSKQVVLCGSIAYDYLMKFPGHFNEHILPEHIDRLSLSFLVDEMRKQRGGVSANIAYNMGLLGATPLLFGTVGQDFGEYRQALDGVGVDTSGVTVIEDKFTASFFVNTDLDNRQIASFYAGAMGNADQLSLKDLDRSKIEFVVISPNAIEAMAKAVRECKELDLPYVYDPGQQTVRLEKDDLLAGLDGSLMLLANDYELSLIEKKTDLTSAEIEKLTHLLIVTKGEHGASIITDDASHHVDAVTPKEIADPTGGGDAFRGGFFRAYTAGADLQTAGKIGALAATYCLEAAGTQVQSYTREQFVSRWESVYGDPARVHEVLGL
ncbi:MAG: ribokinase [Planctomycetaceae bacterium]|nr:ribokinase [Planctomycetaceae bacterium]